jgi:hypothetical protein
MSQTGQSRNRIFDKRSARIGLFLLTLFAVMLVIPLADVVACNYLIFDYAVYGQEAWRHPVILFGVAGPAGLLVGWLSYLTISSVAVFFASSWRAFWGLYAAFVILLAVNIGFVLIFTLSFGRSFGYSC